MQKLDDLSHEEQPNNAQAKREAHPKFEATVQPTTVLEKKPQ
jgi:hypothetical protein